MAHAEPAQLFDGTVAIVAPHMDDELLACGGLVAGLPDPTVVHVIYATDGSRPYAPVIPWRDTMSPAPGPVRMDEARAGMAVLGVPEENLHFLGLPENRLRRYKRELSRRLEDLLSRLKPEFVLVPFRYDRHSDHLAVNQAVTGGVQAGSYGAQARLYEYFVYYRWQLLPGKDLRAYIRPDLLTKVPIGAHAARKRAALACHRSQTTPYFYPWQERPNLTESLLDEECRNPEYFLRYDPRLPGTTVFTRGRLLISLLHRLEPFLKKRKDRALAFSRRVVREIRGNARRTA